MFLQKKIANGATVLFFTKIDISQLFQWPTRSGVARYCFPFICFLGQERTFT
jgi:hypothetical protein